MSSEFTMGHAAFYPTPKTDAHLNAQTHTYSPSVGPDFARELERENNALRSENTTLRTLVAKAAIPCAYCGLDDMSKCKSGFPGCAKADDLICGEDEHSRALLAETKQLRAKVGELERLLVDRGVEVEHLQELLDDNNDRARDT